MLKLLKRKLKEKKSMWISLFIAFIMIFSAFGVIFYGYSESATKLKYGDFTFTAMQNGFATKIDGRQYLFTNHPAVVEGINISSEVVDKIKNTKMLYLTYDPNQSVVQEIAAVQFQFQSDLGNFGIFAAPAFTKKTEYSLPVVSCANATAYVPVVEFKESNYTGIDVLGDCIIFAAAYPEDFSRLKDRTLYGMLGIIK
jgi:hypothetical protein